MNQKKLFIELNLSNQSNLVETIRSQLSQFNFIVVLGNEYLNRGDEKQAQIPLQIGINKSGELTIGGLTENILYNKEKVRIYSDKRITHK